MARAPAVLLLPTALGDARSLEPLTVALRRRWPDADLYAPSWSPELVDPRELVDVLVAADPAPSRPRVVVGLSFGGTLAQLLVRRHPERVAGVLLVGSGSPDPARGRALGRTWPLLCWLPTSFHRRRALREAGSAAASIVEGQTRAELLAPRARLIAADRTLAFGDAELAGWGGAIEIVELEGDGVIAPTEAALVRLHHPRATVRRLDGFEHRDLLRLPARLVDEIVAAVERVAATD